MRTAPDTHWAPVELTVAFDVLRSVVYVRVCLGVSYSCIATVTPARLHLMNSSKVFTDFPFLEACSVALFRSQAQREC